jgi:hypothetical protein
MLYRLIMLIAVLGLVQKAEAADIDIAYLRGSNVYQVQQGAAPWYPTSAPARSYAPISEGPITPAPPIWWWCPRWHRCGHSKFRQSIRLIDFRG